MAADRPTRARFARFGVFEVDLREETLRKRGSRIRLQHQPLRILRLHPFFEPLRTDPRLKALFETVGLSVDVESRTGS